MVKWKFFSQVDPEREYLALVTFLPLPRSKTRREFLRRAGTVWKQLGGTHGIVGFTVRGKFLRRRFYTLSIWEDREALNAFLDKPPHAEAMVALGPHPPEDQKFVFATWNVRGSAPLPRWEEAFERLRE